MQGLLEYRYSSKGSSQSPHIALHSIVVSTRNRMFVFFDTDSMHIVSLVCVCILKDTVMCYDSNDSTDYS